MHNIQAVEGVVLGKRGLGEANTLVALLTRELGLVRASARSARVEKSKLRYGLEPLTRGTFSLVRGKHEWKLTGVQDISREFCAPHISADRRTALGRVAKLLLRLVQGEEAVPQLFETLVEGFQFLVDAPARPDDPGRSGGDAIECVLVLRILAHLGYLPQSAKLEPFVGSSLFSLQLAEEAARSRTLLIKTINESLQATGL